MNGIVGFEYLRGYWMSIKTGVDTYSTAQVQRRTRLHSHNYMQQNNLPKVGVVPI